MDEKVKNDEKKVMLVRQTGEGKDGRLKAVGSIDEDGNIETLDPTAANVAKLFDVNTNQPALEAFFTKFMEQFDFDAVVPVSAQTGDGVGGLVDELKKQAMPGAHFFDDDALTDQPERVLAGEIIREKLLRLLDKEVPHGVAVSIEKMKERENGIIDIDATIFCERDTHKGIIIGKGGAMLKRVGTYARADMEQFFGGKINLKLWVKVKEDWRNREGLLRNFGYSQSDFDQ